MMKKEQAADGEGSCSCSGSYTASLWVEGLEQNMFKEARKVYMSA